MLPLFQKEFEIFVQSSGHHKSSPTTGAGSMQNVSESELYQIIGELFVARAKTDSMLKQMFLQADEMSRVITDLRNQLDEAKNGKLEQPDNHDTV
jgi:hypothetical protein